jgi:hypothetical protein
MVIFCRNILIVGVLLWWPVEAWATTPLYEETFSSAKPLNGWAVFHFRGDASMTMSSIQEEGYSCARLSIHGKGYIVDTFYTSLPILSNLQKKLEITFRYKASRALPIFVSLSKNYGCVDPCIREPITLEGDGKWHDTSVLLDLRWMQGSSHVFEFVVDNVGLNNAKDGDFILFDDIQVKNYIPAKETTPQARWRSPGSRVLIDKTPSQSILLDLVTPEEKTSSFDIEVRSAETSKTVYQDTEKVIGDQKTIRIDAENIPVGSYIVEVKTDDKEVVQWTFKKYPYRENVVWIQDGVPYFNGKPFLILGLYHSSDTIVKIVNGKTIINNPSELMKDLNDSKDPNAWTRDRMFKGMSERGFNTVFYSWGVAPVSYFKDADKYGLKVVCESQNLFDLVKKVKNQPNILGWYGLDEATPNMAALCADIYQQYKAIDPYHPVMAAFCTGGMGYGDHRMVDCVMPDPYPFRSADADFNLKVGYHMVTDQEGLLHDDPTNCIIYIPQLFTTDGWAGYIPTIEQIRAEVYTAVYYGARGFFYYAMFTPEPFGKGMPLNPSRKYWFLPESILWNEVGSLNQELMAMKDMILLSKVDNTITVKSVGSAMGRGLILPDKRQYVLLVNTGAKPQTEIQISGLKPSQEMLAQSNSPVAKSDSKGLHFVDLKGYGVGIYLVKDSDSAAMTRK